jgi:hypothetical protein
MKKLLLLLIVFLPLCGTVVAQNNGFLGRHFMAGYQVHAFPRTFDIIDAVDAPGVVQVPTINFSHEIHASAIVGRYTTLQLSYLRAGYNAVRYERYNLPEVATIEFESNGFGAAVLLYMKKKSSPLAPVGSYIKLQAQYLTFTMNDPVGAMETEWYDTPITPSPKSFTGQSGRVVVGKGRTRVIKERVIVDYGADLMVGLGRKVFDSYGEQRYDDRYYNVAGMALQAPTLNFHLGVGGLLF